MTFSYPRLENLEITSFHETFSVYVASASLLDPDSRGGKEQADNQHGEWQHQKHSIVEMLPAIEQMGC